jgi:uncharacterized membrane protein YqaE (UPF0057 family)
LLFELTFPTRFPEPSRGITHAPRLIAFGVGRFFGEGGDEMADALNPDERRRSISLYGSSEPTPIQELPMDFIRIIIAILLPPLGVFLQVGFGGAFWLNILLTLCGYIPGIVHAVYIIAKR